MQPPHQSEAVAESWGLPLSRASVLSFPSEDSQQVWCQSGVGLLATWPPCFYSWTTEEFRPTKTCRLPTAKTGPKERGPPGDLSTRLARRFLARHSSLDLTYALPAMVPGLFQGLCWIAGFPLVWWIGFCGRMELE